MIHGVTIIPMRKKAISTSLSIFLFTFFNCCFVKCAFAASEQSHHEETVGSSCHDRGSSNENRHDPDPEKHEAGSPCCSSLVADQIPFGNFSESQFLRNPALKNFVATAPLFVASPLNHPQHREEFPPGTSPPAVFLSAHFTHAPPAIL